MITSSKVNIDFEFVDPCLCNAWVATAVIGSAVIGAGAQMYGANKAADIQGKNADKVAAMQQGQYDRTRADLEPYRNIGGEAGTQLTRRLSELTTPISVNPQDFLDSDYYKFLEKQGLKQVGNSAAARGLGASGAALKGAAAFSKGLNSQEWINNFNIQNTNQTNAYTRLKALVDTGQNAAAQTGSFGATAAQNAGAALTGGANAGAAAANATGTAISNMAGNIGGYAQYQGLYGNNNWGLNNTGKAGSAFQGPVAFS